MLTYREGRWVIEIAKDCISDELDAFIEDRFNEVGRYLNEDDLVNDNDINVPSHILDKAKEMLEDVLKAIG
ncbi:MAG: hypothetical protein ABS939_15335 [Psychrobacillus sp.]